MKIVIPHNTFFYRILSCSGQLLIKQIETILTRFSGSNPVIFKPENFNWTIDFHCACRDNRSNLQPRHPFPVLSDCGRKSFSSYFAFACQIFTRTGKKSEL